MSDRFITTIQDLFADFQTAEATGSVMLASTGMLVPANMPHLALLIKSFPKPVATNLDPAEVNYAGGLQTSVPSIPKTMFEGGVTLIETDTGQAAAFAEQMQLMGEMDFILYDGRADRCMRAHKLHKCKMTFDVAEVDSENRTQPLIYQGQIKYNYFGMAAALGVTGNAGNVIVQADDALLKFANQATSIVSALQAGNRVINAMSSLL